MQTTSVECVKTNLRVEYGSSTGESFVNLFKPALRNESFGVVWAERVRNISGNYGHRICGVFTSCVYLFASEKSKIKLAFTVNPRHVFITGISENEFLFEMSVI